MFSLEKRDGIIARPRIRHGKVLDPNLTLRKPGDTTQLGLPKGAIARYGKGRINDIKYSPDNSLLAISTTIGIWLHDTNSGEVLALLTGHTKATSVLAFSPNGDLLASGSNDATIRLWDTTTYQPFKRLKRKDLLKQLRFPLMENRLQLAAINSIQLWNLRSGQPPSLTFNIHQNYSTISDLVFPLMEHHLQVQVSMTISNSGMQKLDNANLNLMRVNVVI